jgi:hypothetical protein
MTRHRQLVADWVEVFAPVVFEPHRPSAWPTAGSLLLDDLPFFVRDPATGRFRIAFRVICAAGFEPGAPEAVARRGLPDASQANWEAVLRPLEGAPPRVVCDNHFGLNGAVRAAFPEAEPYLREWQLRHALERLMAKIRPERCAPRHDRRAVPAGRRRLHRPGVLEAVRPATLRPQEPRAHEPATAAHGATRQPPGRSARPRQGDPGVAGTHRRPATASPDEPLPTPPAGPRCADLTQNAPSDAMGAD